MCKNITNSKVGEWPRWVERFWHRFAAQAPKLTMAARLKIVTNNVPGFVHLWVCIGLDICTLLVLDRNLRSTTLQQPDNIKSLQTSNINSKRSKMDTIFSSIDFAALLSKHVGRILWPGEQGLEVRLCQAYHLFAALSDEAKRTKLRPFRRFVYIAVGKLESGVAKFYVKTDEMKTLAANVGSVSIMTPEEFLRGLARDYDSGKGASWAVVMDAECLAHRDGFRILVELDTMLDQLASGSKDCKLKTLVFAMFGTKPDEMHLGSFSPKELTLEPWVSPDPDMEGTLCATKLENPKWRTIETSDKLVEELAAEFLHFFNSRDSSKPVLIVLGLPFPIVWGFMGSVLKYCPELNLAWANAKPITKTAGKGCDATIAGLWREPLTHMIISLTPGILSYSIPLGKHVSIFIGWTGRSGVPSRSLDSLSNRTSQAGLNTFLANMKTEVQSVKTMHSVNEDVQFFWVYDPETSIVISKRPAMAFVDDIKWTALLSCGPMVAQGSRLDKYKWFPPIVASAIERSLEPVKHMQLVETEMGSPGLSVSAELRDLEQHLLDKGVERTYPVPAAFLWARCKVDSDSELVWRANIRIGAILAAGPPTINTVAGGGIPTKAMKEIWAQCAPFCFGGQEQNGYLWVMLGLYEHFVQVGGTGLYGPLEGASIGEGPPFAVHIQKEWVRKITGLVSAVEEMHGILPAQNGWSNRPLNTSELSDLYSPLTYACVENAVVFIGNERICNRGVTLEGNAPIKLKPDAMYGLALRKKCFGLAENIVYDPVTRSLVGSGITLMPFEFINLNYPWPQPQ